MMGLLWFGNGFSGCFFLTRSAPLAVRAGGIMGMYIKWNALSPAVLALMR